MQSKFQQISPEAITDNPFKLIDHDWLLITAGSVISFNCMTASWGGLGILWNKNVATVFVRPTRHTYRFMEKNTFFTLTFFEEKYRDILDFCGSQSGRNIDKVKATGLKVLETQNRNIYYEQARLVIECRKIYYDDLKPDNFLMPEIHKNYPMKDYHRMYVGEITECLLKTEN